MEALQALLQTAPGIGQVSRRNRAPEAMASPDAPGFALVKSHETYVRLSPKTPPKRTLHVLGIIYIDVGPDDNAIPDAVLNPLQDAIDAALAPDDYQTGCCTLGGLVEWVVIKGEVTCAPGDVTGKGLAVIPFEILIP